MALARRRAATVRAAIACAALLCAAPASAQLRIVDYNIAQNYDIAANPGGLDVIFNAIGEEVRNGFAKRIDILAAQELDSSGSDAALLASLLNGMYGVTTYMAAPVPGNAVSGGNGLPGLVYNSATVTLSPDPPSPPPGSQNVLAFGNVGSAITQQPRSTLRYRLRPVGYDAAADFYLYNSHYKSEDDSEGQQRRLVEAASIRDNADALGEGAHALYVGDLNVYRSTEPMYVELLSAGAGQAFDPIAMPGNWSAPSQAATFKGIHTQSPATVEAFPGQVLGGMDDRFDFQLVTGELQDGEGMSYLAGSYHTFGNNGTHAVNGAISTGSGAAGNVLDALKESSDHLPVVADYQLPAKMQVQVASLPPSVGVGAAVSIDVLVQNIAAAAAAIGVDELDYTLSVTGDLLGGASGMDAPLGGGNTHQVTLNTATAGMKSGVITVSSTSQGAAGALFTMPVSFTVGGGGPPTRETIAADDFDYSTGRISFTQSPAPGTLPAPTRGFQTYQVGVSPSIPNVLKDDSAGAFPADTHGVINTATKTDVWFGVVDTVDATNPGGDGVATWMFDVSGASSLEVSIDMGAMGNFESTGGNPDSYHWTYALDGGAFQPLFTSTVDEALDADYTLAGGGTFNLIDPLFMTNTASQTVQLSNVLQTLTSAIVGTGDVLTLRLTAHTDGATDEAFAFDNILVTGLVADFDEADFNEDGFVDGLDLAAWKTGFPLAASADKDDGDADADGDVDGADFLTWQRQLGGAPATAVAASVPEPGALGLAIGAALAATRLRRRAG